MKKLKALSPDRFLRLLFAFFTLAFFVGAVILPDRAAMFDGLWRIASQPAKVSTNYFDYGGFSGAFLNAGLVCLICTLIAFELCWIGAKYVIEGVVVHTCLDHFIAVCGSFYLTRDTMKLWLKLQNKSQRVQH